MSLLALGLLLCLGAGSKAQTPNQNEKLDPAPLVVELTAMVAQHGWVANLGRMCPAMRIGGEADCRFKQISVSASPPGTIDNHGFNVQLHKSRQRISNHYFSSRGTSLEISSSYPELASSNQHFIAREVSTTWKIPSRRLGLHLKPR